MKKAAAVVTNRGGRTCHAAIIARELGIPAVVGCRRRDRTHEEDDQNIDSILCRRRYRLCLCRYPST
ncbi:PEP-utilizing enzyme [Shigella flexneri]